MSVLQVKHGSTGKGLSPAAACLALLFLFSSLIASAQNHPSLARWITAAGASEHDQQMVLFRKIISLPTLSSSYPVHVSADNRFWLYVNGRRVGDGPARGDLAHWRYESFDLRPYLHRGSNVLAARVWNYGNQSPAAQISFRTGFLLWSDATDFSAANTNASWSARIEHGWSASLQGYPAAPGESIDAHELDSAWNTPQDAMFWLPSVEISTPIFAANTSASLRDGTWHLVPDLLPRMESSSTPVGHVIRSVGMQADHFPDLPLEVPAHTHLSLLLDRDDLTTAYPELTVGGGAGAKLRLTYAEALVDEKGIKGNRNDTVNKHMDMAMLHDEFLADGSPRTTFSPTWWRTWRFLQLDIATGEQPLSLFDLKASFSAYPFAEKATFKSDDRTLEKIWEVGWRTHRLNAHETHMDCPYWEQTQYAGDTRIEALLDYVMSGDDRLARQAIASLADSRLPEGLTQSSFPVHGVQVIPPFSLLWIGMMHDYWMYRSHPEFLQQFLPVSRSVLAWFTAQQRPDGMLGKLPQNGFGFWNFVDWSYAPIGAPPEDADGGSVPITLQYLAALRDAADLEEAVGDPARAKVYRENARRIASTVYLLAWDRKLHLLADTPAHEHFSQHANMLGVILDVIPASEQKQAMETILTGELSGTAPASAPQNLTTASYYFRFYLARAIDHAGMGDLYLKLLGPWKNMLQLGLTTWAETPEPSRSDAHDWSSHPNFDFLTLVAGIQPDAAGFKRVRIAPHLDGMTTLDAAMPHPLGSIQVSYRKTRQGVNSSITLPVGLEGVLEWKGKEYPLHGGTQALLLP